MAKNSEAQIRHIYEEWHEAVVRRDLARLAALYAPDASFESPSVYALDGREDGILKGREQIAAFFESLFRKLDKDVAEWFRTGTFFSNGETLTWEYPRQTPRGDQTDLVESMDIEDGLIVEHRVYWGWVGLKALLAAVGKSA